MREWVRVVDWQEVTLGEVADISWGDTSTTKASFTESGYTAYSASGPDGSLPYFDHEHDGVVISAIGAQCGRTWLARGRWSCIKNTMWMKGRPAIADTGFLYYCTRRANFWPRRGAAQPFISLGDARAIRIVLPELAVQRRLTAVLAVFDGLITINERRIVLLEELAKSLYREWFMRFRFPGHERIAMVNSQLGPIPEGWEVVNLGKIVRLRYGKSLTAKARRPGPYVVVSSAGVVGEHDEALSPGPGVVVGRKGNVGSVWWIDAPFFPIDTTYYIETDEPLGLIYWQLRHVAFIDSHAAVPGLSREQAYSLQVLCPDRSLAERFNAVHVAYFKSIAELRNQNEALADVRDLILPRLVTGRLDISDIDLGDLLSEEAA
jgi:type I restriction enzyme S subunit